MKIKFPHAVKIGGIIYAPYAVISVQNASEYLEMGAVLVEEKKLVQNEISHTEAEPIEKPKKNKKSK